MADKDPWNPLGASISNQSAQKQPGLFRQTIDTLKGGEYKKLASSRRPSFKPGY